MEPRKMVFDGNMVDYFEIYSLFIDIFEIELDLWDADGITYIHTYRD